MGNDGHLVRVLVAVITFDFFTRREDRNRLDPVIWAAVRGTVHAAASRARTSRQLSTDGKAGAVCRGWVIRSVPSSSTNQVSRMIARSRALRRTALRRVIIGRIADWPLYFEG